MLFLPELAEIVATVTRREPTVVTFAARTLRKDGLFPQTKRGRGATPMTAREAAQLILAVAGMQQAQQSSSVVNAYWRLKPTETRGVGGQVLSNIKRADGVDAPGDLQPELKPLYTQPMALGETLEFLIDRADALQDYDVAIEIRSPLPVAMIQLRKTKEVTPEFFSIYGARRGAGDGYDALVLGRNGLLVLHRALSGSSVGRQTPEE